MSAGEVLVENEELDRGGSAATAAPYRTSLATSGSGSLAGLPLPIVLTRAGTHLAVRLVPRRARRREFHAHGAAAVVWAAVFSVLLASELRAPGVLLGLLLIPFAVFGAFLVLRAARCARRLGLGERAVELNAHPLRQATTATVSVLQVGPLRGARITVELRGTERAAIANGTSAPVTRRFLTARLVDREPVDLAAGERWTRCVPMPLPDDLPASFEVANASLYYELVVVTETTSGSDEDAFPVLVLPGGWAAGG